MTKVMISGRLSFDGDYVPHFQNGPNNMSFGQLFADFEGKIILVCVAEICGAPPEETIQYSPKEHGVCTLRPGHQGDHRAVVET